MLLYKEFSPAAVIELFSRRESLLRRLQQADRLSVYVGDELEDEALQNASLIAASYTVGGALKGRMAVLGPLKADYTHLIPTVAYLAEATEESLEPFI